MASFAERNIDKFKSKLTGGGARPNLFQVDLGWPPLKIGGDKTDLTTEGTFMVKAAELPASNIGDIPVNFRGRILHVAGDRTFDPWTVTVINNTDWKLRTAFEDWSQQINDRTLDSGITDPTSYHGDMVVKQLARGTVEGKTKPTSIPMVAQYKFFGCWPSQVSSIALDYGSTDTIEEFQVTFQVTYWERDIKETSTGAKFPTPEAAIA